MIPSPEREAAAALLEQASRSGIAVAPLTERWPALDQDDAYAIQRTGIERRVAAGARRVGWKVGLTSEAMQRQLGVDQPDFGPLLDEMAVPDGGTCALAPLIAPRVEAEIALVLGADLEGKGLDIDAVLAATGRVVPALEIIDSRVADWRIRLEDTVADHASCARYVLGAGGGCAPDACDLAAAELRFSDERGELGRGHGAAVLGHPANAVAWLAGTLAQHGERLRAGEVVLAGALTAAVPVRAGQRVLADFGAQIGAVAVAFADGDDA